MVKASSPANREQNFTSPTRNTNPTSYMKNITKNAFIRPRRTHHQKLDEGSECGPLEDVLPDVREEIVQSTVPFFVRLLAALQIDRVLLLSEDVQCARRDATRKQFEPVTMPF